MHEGQAMVTAQPEVLSTHPTLTGNYNKIGLRSMCVCVCGNVKPCCLESTPGLKRERTPTRGHTRLSPPPLRSGGGWRCAPPVVRLLRATRNLNFYLVNMSKEIVNYNYWGGGGVMNQQLEFF